MDKACTDNLCLRIGHAFYYRGTLYKRIASNQYSFYLSLPRCDSEFLSTREPSILLTGGNTKITGFVERFRSELTRAKVDRAITAPEERIYSTWVGGSILASHSSFSERWISDNDYSEHGANIVNRRSSLFWSICKIKKGKWSSITTKWCTKMVSTCLGNTL